MQGCAEKSINKVSTETCLVSILRSGFHRLFVGSGDFSDCDPTLLARNFGDVVAVCDVDKNHVDKAVEYFATIWHNRLEPPCGSSSQRI